MLFLHLLQNIYNCIRLSSHYRLLFSCGYFLLNGMWCMLPLWRICYHSFGLLVCYSYYVIRDLMLSSILSSSVLFGQTVEILTVKILNAYLQILHNLFRRLYFPHEYIHHSIVSLKEYFLKASEVLISHSTFSTFNFLFSIKTSQRLTFIQAGVLMMFL